MESGLPGLQREASASITHCLILRAHKTEGALDKALERTQFDDYVYPQPAIESCLSRIVAPIKISSIYAVSPTAC